MIFPSSCFGLAWLRFSPTKLVEGGSWKKKRMRRLKRKRRKMRQRSKLKFPKRVVPLDAYI
ncbi:hypothetical protein Taro_031440 [Colocasia esculenta]|uniref:60S ribosomal protein L41 n=1 Tax=Colocasia esculenta TaxID=4460 RepID=A0A843VQ03_COLES|nr:hypothetical protein [Colocasia esculenta]